MQFEFNLFYQQYLKYFPSAVLPTIHFLQWLIGFAEGDGSFTITKRGDLHFVISQSSEDVQLLYYIKENLNLGQVIVQSKVNRVHRFILQDFKSIHLICLLFNGNMVMPTRNAKFINFLAKFNEKALKKNLGFLVLPVYETMLPTLDDFWLSGFCDAEGCFFSSYNQKTRKFTIRLIIAQKWLINRSVLDYILKLFSLQSGNSLVGYVNEHSVSDVWELSVHGVKNCYKLIVYFDNYELKSKKLQSYNYWKQLLSKFNNKDHLNLDKQEELVDLIKRLHKSN